MNIKTFVFHTKKASNCNFKAAPTAAAIRRKIMPNFLFWKKGFIVFHVGFFSANKFIYPNNFCQP